MSLAHRLDGSEIDAVYTARGSSGEAIEDVSRLGVGLIIRTAVEAEVDAFSDRPR